MRDKHTSKNAKPAARCAMCNGRFGLIRHRLAHKQFCSKRCLDHYLAIGEQKPFSTLQWTDFLRRTSFAFRWRERHGRAHS
jgi:hypothetical protein